MFSRTGRLAGEEFEIEGSVSIGRDAANDVVLPLDLVSSRHARIEWDEGQGCFLLEDLQSRNGTELDGTPVRGRQRLGPLHVITFAHELPFIFQLEPAPRAAPPKTSSTALFELPPELPSQVLQRLGDEPESGGSPPGIRTTISEGLLDDIPAHLLAGSSPAPEPAPEPVAPPPEPVAPPPEARSRVILEVKLEGRWEKFLLGTGDTVVGRTGEADVTLRCLDVSRRHATLRREGKAVTLRDLGSSNGTTINGQKVGREEAPLRPGDVLAFGAVEARVVWKEER